MPTISIIYTLTGMAVIYLFQQRRKQLSTIRHDDFPELDSEGYRQLIQLLKTAYERTLYLGVLFFPLAWSARPDGEKITQYFFFSLIILLFLSNIFPRNAIMRLLEKYSLERESLKERGITL